MTILIVHLSDIHFKSSDNSIFNKLDKLCNAIQNSCLDCDALFFVITGDIAYSGKNEEYNEAMLFLDNIKKHIEAYASKSLNIIMIPGNHDCNHDISGASIRALVIKQIRDKNTSKDKLENEVIEQCCKVQNDWFEFNEFYHDKINLTQNDKLLRIYKYDYSDKSIILNCYNTAWLSEEKETPGLIFPLKIYPPDIFRNKADIIISIFHHPIIWQNINTYREFRNHIDMTSDIVLTGHEHISSKEKKDNLQGNVTEYIEGGVLQDHQDLQKSEFNIIKIDTNNQSHNISTYKWNGNIYSSLDSENWKPYTRLSNLRKKEFELKPDFQNFIDDAGAMFKHPLKAELTLKDFFVFPNLRNLTEEKDKKDNAIRQREKSDFLQKLNEKGTKAILMGIEKSGKTALCRRLYEHYYNKNYVPILIEGHNIKSSSEIDIGKVIDKNFVMQYSQNQLESFKQFNNKNKVLIIDDFDKSILNVKHKSLLINNINRLFTHIIITTNDLFPVEELLYEENQCDSLKEFGQFTIMDFGFQLRNELINKWNTLGQEQFIDDEELIRKNNDTERIVNSIVGYNYVPKLPIFLLTILQMIEAGQTHNLKESSYGHYYGYLITQTLTKLRIGPEDLEAYYNYITELSFHLFTEKVREIPRNKLQDFHNKHCLEYKIKLNFEIVINILIKASILFENNHIIRIRYKFVYYYFVARYLSHNFSEPKTKEVITELCKRLHVEEFANIILFLTHHSRDPFVLNEILINAKNIFSEYDAIKFDKDTSYVNDLLSEVPQLVYRGVNVKEHREKLRKAKDEKEIEKHNEKDSSEDDDLYDYEKEDGELNLIATLNLANKTVEIIGQILKNYYGSLKGPKKLELGEEAYSVGLRALKSFFEMLKGNIDVLVNDIEAMISDKELAEKSEIEEVARKVVFQLSEMISYSFISKTAQALGSEKLSETFKEILASNNSPSVQLIDIAIKLDFYKSFPYDDLKEMQRKLKSNYLPNNLLKHLVINYLYMFPTEYDERQKICSLMDIPIEAARRIDAKTEK